MSDYPTLEVMKSDLPSNVLPPRRKDAAPERQPGIRPLAYARDRTVAELEADLEDTIRRGKAAIPLTPAADGTPGISSLIAVWVLTEVGKELGTNKSPVKLSTVQNPEALRSIGGVARLLHDVLHPAAAIAS